MSRLYLVGIGFKPLEERARKVVLNSRLILTSSNRLFEIFKGYAEFEKVKDKVKVINNVDATIDYLKSAFRIPHSAIIVLLTSGDPMFSGIGRRAVNEFGKDALTIFPDLSSIQVAFSRIKETWDDAFLISLHGGKRKKLKYEINDLPLLLKEHKKIAILTDKKNTPSAIAKAILKPSAISYQLSAIKMFVCERLGYPDEKITEGIPEEIAGLHFSEPNVVIVLRGMKE